MQALVTEIWMWMAASGLVSGITIWLLARFSAGRASARVEKNWQTRVRASEDSWHSKLRSAEQNFSSQLDQKTAQISLLQTDFQSEKGRRVAMADELAKWKSDMATLLEEQDLISAKLRRMDERLAVALEDADQLDLEVKRLTAEVNDLEHEAEGYKLRSHLLEPLEEQVRELEASLEEKTRRIGELAPLQDQLTERVADIELMESEHRAEIERRSQEATRLRTKIGELEPRSRSGASEVGIGFGQRGAGAARARLGALQERPTRNWAPAGHERRGTRLGRHFGREE